MPLENQIITIFFSLIYGVIFFLLLELNYKFIYKGKIIYRVIVTFLFVMFNTLLYFIILRKINNGVVHVYFLLCILTGYILSNFVYKKCIVKKNKQ